MQPEEKTRKKRWRKQWRPFEEARAFARSLNLLSSAEWVKYSKSGQKPDDIPALAHRVYKDSGWLGWGDWLGTGIFIMRIGSLAEARGERRLGS
jgi:hypothetical protein